MYHGLSFKITIFSRFTEIFDMVFVAQNYFKFVSEELLHILKPQCPVVVETRKFVISYDKRIGDFGDEVRDKMKVLRGIEVTSTSFTKHSHGLFKVKCSSENCTEATEING